MCITKVDLDLGKPLIRSIMWGVTVQREVVFLPYHLFPSLSVGHSKMTLDTTVCWDMVVTKLIGFVILAPLVQPEGSRSCSGELDGESLDSPGRSRPGHPDRGAAE